MIGSIHTLGGLSGAIADFLRSMDSVRKAIGVEVGLSAGELRAMAVIAESDGVTPKQIADDLELTTGAITAITNGLVAKNLIIRTEQSHDRRSLLITLTPQGHSVMESAYSRFHDVLAAASTSLGADDEVAVTRGLNVITQSVASDK